MFAIANTINNYAERSNNQNWLLRPARGGMKLMYNYGENDIREILTFKDVNGDIETQYNGQLYYGRGELFKCIWNFSEFTMEQCVHFTMCAIVNDIDGIDYMFFEDEPDIYYIRTNDNRVFPLMVDLARGTFEYRRFGLILECELQEFHRFVAISKYLPNFRRRSNDPPQLSAEEAVTRARELFHHEEYNCYFDEPRKQAVLRAYTHFYP